MAALRLWLLVSSGLAAVAGASKISAVSLLLPTDTSLAADNAQPVSVSTSVSASPGCFEWFSSDPGLVIVEPGVDDACPAPLASSATLTVASNATEKASCEVNALNPEDGSTLTVEVYTAPIYRIEILTTVRRLALYEPETLRVQAFDDLGNVFSSLDGLGFTWSTAPAESAGRGAKTPLLVTRISESQVTPTHGLEQEYFGRYGYKVQVAGEHAGRGVVHAVLEATREDRVATEVEIDVVEPLSLCPVSPVLVPGTVLPALAIRREGKNKYEVLRDTAGKYEWAESSAGTVLDVDARDGIVTALEPGRAVLTFRQQDYTANAATSLVRVVPLNGLNLWFAPFENVTETRHGLSGPAKHCPWSAAARFPQSTALSPLARWVSWQQERWVLTHGRRYFVMATLASEQVNMTAAIFVTQAMEFAFASASAEAGPGGLAVLTEAESVGLPNVRVLEAAELGFVDLSVHFSFAGTALDAQKAHVEITAPLLLAKPVIRLPVDPVGKIFHSWVVRASGGTGFLTFSLDGAEAELECAPVHQSGIAVDPHSGRVKVREQRPSSEIVHVSDTFDASNHVEARVLVSLPSAISLQIEAAHIAVGEVFDLHALLLDADGEAFDNCTGFQERVEWSLHGASIELLPDRRRPKDVAAEVCAWQGVIAKQPGTTTVSARYGDTIVATARVTVIEKVHIIRPGPDRTLDPMGNSVLLLPLGAWGELVVAGGEREDTFTIVESSGASRDGVSLAFARHEQQYRVHKVTCAREGDYRVTVQAKATLVVLCRPVASAEVALALPQDALDALQEDRCVVERRVHCVSGQDLRLRLRVLDIEERHFASIAGLTVAWDVDSGLDFAGKDEGEGDGSERAVRLPPSFEGTVRVSASILGDDVAKAALALVVSSDIALEHAPSLLLLADPAAEEKLRIIGGPDELENSLRCTAAAQEPALAAIATRGRSVTITYALQRPQEGRAAFSCRMPCLIGSRPIEAHVDFAFVSLLRIRGPAKVREGQEVRLSVQALNAAGVAFSKRMHDHIGVVLVADPPALLAITPDEAASCADASDRGDTCEGALGFSGTTAASGSAALQATAGAATAEHALLIFKSIQIIPGVDKTVEPGTRFVLKRAYGPFSDAARCRFETEAGAVVEVLDEPAGLFKAARLGRAKIAVRCREDGVVIDEDSVSVHVKYLEEMSVEPRTAYFAEGQRVRVHVGFPEIAERPLDFAALQRAFTWRVANESVAQLVGYREGDAYSVWVEGLEPGVTTIQVSSAVRGEGGKPLVASAEIVIGQRLELRMPSEVMLPRRGELAVQTSLTGGGGVLVFSVRARGCGLAVAPLVVHADGRIAASDKIGSGEVVVEHRAEHGGLELVQEVSIHVIVRPVGFVAIEPEYDEVGLPFPLGVGQTLRASLHDVHGRRFTAPFSTLALDVKLSDPKLANVVHSPTLGDEEGVDPAFTYYIVTGRQEGATSLAASVRSEFEAEAREDYMHVAVVPAAEAIHFSLGALQDRQGALIVVPGAALRVPIRGAGASARRALGLSCSANVAGRDLAAAVEVQARKAYCEVDIPATLTADGSVMTLAMHVQEKLVVEVSVAFTLGFRLASTEVAIESDRLAWPAGAGEVVLDILGGAAAAKVVAKSSDVHVLSVVRASPTRFVLRAQHNETCGVGTDVVFSHAKQRQVLRVTFPCGQADGVLPWPGQMRLPPALQLGHLLLGTALALALLCCLCSGSCAWTSAASSTSQKPVSFREMDSPAVRKRTLPPLLRDQDLGSPMRVRHSPMH